MSNMYTAENCVQCKGYGYVRVSTKGQKDGASPDVQRKAIQDYAARNNIKLVHTFEDLGVSAKTMKREGMEEMLKECLNNKGKIDYVIVYDMSRFTRNNDTFGPVASILDKIGVKLRSATEVAIDESPIGKYMRNISVANAQFFNDQLGEKVHDSMAERAENGFWTTHVPLGFKTMAVNEDTLEPIPEKDLRSRRKKYPRILVPNHEDDIAEKITFLLNRFSEGDLKDEQLHKIALEMGVKSERGNPISLDSIRRILREPAYCGYTDSKKLVNGQFVKLKFDGLITLETYQKNQIIINGRDKKHGRRLAPKAIYPLDGTLLCEHCGMPLHGDAPVNGSGKDSPLYYCRGGAKRGHGYSSKNMLEVHEAFDDFLQTITPSDGAIKLFKEMLKRTAFERLNNARPELEKLTKRKQELSDEKTKVLRKLVNDEITNDEKDELVNAIESEKVEIALQEEKIEASQRLNENMIEYICNFIPQPAKMWRDADLESKRAFQEILFPNGLHFDLKTKKCRTEDLSPLYSVICNKNEPNGSNSGDMVIPAGVEPAIFWMRTRRPRPLDDGTMVLF